MDLHPPIAMLVSWLLTHRLTVLIPKFTLPDPISLTKKSAGSQSEKGRTRILFTCGVWPTWGQLTSIELDGSLRPTCYRGDLWDIYITYIAYIYITYITCGTYIFTWYIYTSYRWNPTNSYLWPKYGSTPKHLQMHCCPFCSKSSNFVHLSWQIIVIH